MIKLCHIAPVKHSGYVETKSEANLVLAHIADKSDDYCNVFRNSNNETILDNGAFELGTPYPTEKMIELGRKVGADVLVLPDYPFEHWTRGWDFVEQDIAKYKEAGFRTMFVPQSLKGDDVGYLMSFEQAMNHPLIDLVGMSILGAPNAFDKIPTHKVREFIIRQTEGIIKPKSLHILGMLGSVDEIKRLKFYSHLINSWDTSAAVWYGLNDLTVRDRKDKFKLPVDFFTDLPYTPLCDDNIKYMRSLR